MQHDSTPQNPNGAHLADQTKLPKDVQRVFKLLERLPMGSLKLTGPKGQIYQFGNDRAPHVELTVHDWVIFSETLQAGDIGFS